MRALDELIATVAALRDPETGCPWDLEQDHQSLAACLIDECCELLQTIDRHDRDHMEEELGDVLLQVLMHAQLAKESGHFDFAAVCEAVNDKLIRRHPHVFGDAETRDSASVVREWETIKAGERKRGRQSQGVFKDLPRQLPALMYARDIAKQIERQDLDASGVVEEAAVEREADGLDEAEAGRRLFAIAAACRRSGVDPESALRRHAEWVKENLEARHGAATAHEAEGERERG